MDTDLSCMISNRLTENGFQVGRFFRNKSLESKEDLLSGWVFIQGQEGEEWFSDPVNFQLVPLSRIILHNPHIRKYLDKPMDSEFIVDPESGQINEVEGHWLLSNTYATHPGKLAFNPIALMKIYPKLLFVALLWLFFLLAAVSGIAWTAWIFAIVIPMPLLFYWFKLHIHFKMGDANPGIIISTHPTLMAVLTDLSKGEGRYPAVAVTQVDFSKINKAAVKPGMQLATVSLYYNSNDSAPHWSDFLPLPAQYATGNKKKIEELLDSFSQEEWSKLDQAIAQIPQPYKEGVYRVNEEITDWKSVKEP